jgi:hypothetical protein
MPVSGQKLVGRVAIVKELVIEDEVLDHERVLVVDLNDSVKKVLKELGRHISNSQHGNT